MPKLREQAAWTPECDAVIVGIRTETATVEQIWLRNDGSISARDRIHYPPPGRTAADEVTASFGLSSVRQFSLPEFGDARIYAAGLRLRLRGGAAQGI